MSLTGYDMDYTPEPPAIDWTRLPGPYILKLTNQKGLRLLSLVN